jgi:hypothetical protein
LSDALLKFFPQVSWEKFQQGGYTAIIYSVDALVKVFATAINSQVFNANLKSEA